MPLFNMFTHAIMGHKGKSASQEDEMQKDDKKKSKKVKSVEEAEKEEDEVVAAKYPSAEKGNHDHFGRHRK